MEMSDQENKLPQVGQGLVPKSHSGDLPDCPEDSGGGNQTLTAGATASALQVPGRRGSAASLASVASAFSNMTESEFQLTRERLDEIVRIREEVDGIFWLISNQLQLMMSSCNIQKNVNKTVKHGLTKVMCWFDEVQCKTRDLNQKDEALRRNLTFLEEGIQDRKKSRSRVQGQLVRDSILAATSLARERTPATKRDRSDSEESDKSPKPEKKRTKKKHRKKKKEEKIDKETRNGEIPRPVPTVTVTSADGAPVLKGRRREVRKPTVLVKPQGGRTFAEVLRKLKQELDVTDCQAKVTSVRPTQKGDLVLHLGTGSDREILADKLRTVVGDLASVSADEKRTVLEVRDLDALTELTEVHQALDKLLGTAMTRRKVHVTKANSRGLKAALLDLCQSEADKVLHLGHLKVGFMCCRVRERTVVVRCHRCLGYGHRKVDCKGVDRSNACFRCGEVGHTLATCQATASCFLCRESTESPDCGHVAGSGGCKVFREALRSARDKYVGRAPKKK